MSDLQKKLESILFSAARRIELQELAKLCKVKPEDALKELEEMRDKLDGDESPLLLMQEGSGWKLTVREKYSGLVNKIVTETELSKSLMETLAVIAWKYPIKQAELIKIRTNKAYEHLKELEETGYITRQKHGRTKLIKLTQKFFDYFDLPREKLHEKFQNFDEMAKTIEKKESEIEKMKEEHNKKLKEEKGEESQSLEKEAEALEQEIESKESEIENQNKDSIESNPMGKEPDNKSTSNEEKEAEELVKEIEAEEEELEKEEGIKEGKVELYGTDSDNDGYLKLGEKGKIDSKKDLKVYEEKRFPVEKKENNVDKINLEEEKEHLGKLEVFDEVPSDGVKAQPKVSTYGDQLGQLKVVEDKKPEEEKIEIDEEEIKKEVKVEHPEKKIAESDPKLFEEMEKKAKEEEERELKERAKKALAEKWSKTKEDEAEERSNSALSGNQDMPEPIKIRVEKRADEIIRSSPEDLNEESDEKKEKKDEVDERVDEIFSPKKEDKKEE